MAFRSALAAVQSFNVKSPVGDEEEFSVSRFKGLHSDPGDFSCSQWFASNLVWGLSSSRILALASFGPELANDIASDFPIAGYNSNAHQRSQPYKCDLARTRTHTTRAHALVLTSPRQPSSALISPHQPSSVLASPSPVLISPHRHSSVLISRHHSSPFLTIPH